MGCRPFIMDSQRRTQEMMMTNTITPIRPSAMAQAGHLVHTTSMIEALEQAGLAHWNVQKLPMWADAREYQGYDYTDLRGIKDESTFKTAGVINGQLRLLGTVGDQYQPVQNEDHAALLDEVVAQSGGRYAQATAFKGGRLVYISILLPDTVTVGGKDPVNMYLNGINSHDGTTHFMLNLSPERAWCANQLGYFRKNSIKFKHSGNVLDKVATARESLGIAIKGVEEFRVWSERLADTRMTLSDYESVLDEVYPMPAEPGQPGHSKRTWNNYTKLRDGLDELWISPANAEISGTAWGGLQSAVEYVQWQKGSDRNRAERIMTSPALEKEMTKLYDAFKSFALAA